MIASLLLAATAATALTHHAVSTQDPAVQALFDRGMTSLASYDRGGAAASFAAALQRDPHLAIAAWGESLAAGPDLNHPLNPQSFAAAQAAAKRAVSLESYASQGERAYIDAIALRYTGSYRDHDKDEQRYAEAMDRIARQVPPDDDAVALEAEALLEDHGGATETRTAVLPLISALLQRNPGHLLGNHLCIHAYDRLTDRTPALACADRLNAMTFAPPDEHLAHVSAHAYVESGEYANAVAASERAWRLRTTWEDNAPPYHLEYAMHDAEIGYEAALMLSDEQTAQIWENRGEQPFGLLTLARFAHWNAIVQGAPDSRGDNSFALGLAYAHLGRLDLADRELAALQNARAASDYAELLAAAIAEKRGRIDTAISALRRAIVLQQLDTLSDEYVPLFPAGEALGALYDRAGRYFDARDALLDTLKLYPSDPRALFALGYACRHIGDWPCATARNEEFNTVWTGLPPDIGDF